MAFNGKVAVVTGGGSGMGRCAARKLAEQGADVAIFDVNEAGMAETAEGFPSIKPYVVDVSNTDAVHEAVRQVESDLGPIDRSTRHLARRRQIRPRVEATSTRRDASARDQSDPHTLNTPQKPSASETSALR